MSNQINSFSLTHEAYNCSELLKSSVRIECIAAYGDHLLVGTKAGHLLVYSIFNSDNKNEAHLLQNYKSFSKKPIQQLAVVQEHQLLISLTGNVVCVHDMAIINFPTLCVLTETRGATLFSVMEKVTEPGEKSLVRICVVVKRKLLLFDWKDGRYSLEEEVSMPDTPKSLAWFKDGVQVGFRGDRVNVLSKDGKNRQTQKTGNQSPCALEMNEEILILGKDNFSTFEDTCGNPVGLKPIGWDEVPRVLVYDEPYLVALLPESIEIRSVEPSLIVQIYYLNDPKMIIRCKSGLLYAASGEFVWCLRNVAWSRQIHVLQKKKQFQLAWQIANISDEKDKAKNVHRIQTLYAHHLFNKKQFKESMEQFLKLETNPFRVVKLFRNLPKKKCRKEQIDAVLKLLVRDSESGFLAFIKNPQDRDLASGLLALIEYLNKVRLLKKIEMEKKNKEFSEREKRRIGKLTREEEGKIDAENKVYKKFCKATEQLYQMIDTTLLKCYLQTNDAFVAPLLRLNHCHFGEAEKLLKEHEKNSELIILYQTKGLHKKALELLQKQSTQQDPSLQGHYRTMLYLQNLGRENIELIFQFAGWVLEEHPMDGLSIFTEEMPEVEGLPRPKVLDYLLRLHKKLVIPYLEHVINVWNDSSTILHHTLIHQYRKEAISLFTAGKLSEEKEVRTKLVAFLEVSKNYSPERALMQFPYDSMFEERAVILGKLGKHEQVLSIYVMMLGDVNRAIQYCHEVFSSQKEGADKIYVLLIKMLISPPDSWLRGVPLSPATSKKRLETAISLLEEHAAKIQPIQALEVLPDTVPICWIRHFLEKSLRKQLNERRYQHVLKGLAIAENLQAQEQRMHYFDSKITSMTEFNVCSVCNKRFVHQSIFACYPNGDVVHYHCQDRKAQQ